MEIELKFEVDAGAAEQLRRALKLPARPKALRSVYFDTPDAQLRSAGVALRVRDDGRRFVQTVKAAGTGIARGEWERVLAGPEPDLAGAADTPLAGALNGCADALAPAFETRVDRVVRKLLVHGATVEAALDRGVIVAGADDAPILELELELKAGEPCALFALARELSAVAPMNLSFLSKAERGYALIGGEALAPVKARDVDLAADDNAAAAFKGIAVGALAQVAANARVLRHARRIEALHQLRVGARRLRSALSLFKPMLADGAVDRIKAELKWLTKELDDARNLDVFITETFRPAAKRHRDWAGLPALGRALITAQTKAYDRAEAALASERFRGLMLETAAWIETGPWTIDPDEFRTALRRRPARKAGRDILSTRTAKVLKKGRRLAKLAPAPRHKLRIAAKKLRYACGFFASLYAGEHAKRQRRFVDAMGELQDALGALTDIAAADGLTVRLAGVDEKKASAAARLAFAAGLVAGERQRDEAAALAAAEAAFKRFRGAKPFW